MDEVAFQEEVVAVLKKSLDGADVRSSVSHTHGYFVRDDVLRSLLSLCLLSSLTSCSMDLLGQERPPPFWQLPENFMGERRWW